MLDSTDLGVVSDLKVAKYVVSLLAQKLSQDLWSEFSELERSKESLLAVGLDLAPHYFNQVTPFHLRRAEFSSPYFSS